MTTHWSRGSLAALVTCALGVASNTFALPSVGGAVPSASVEDADGHALDTRSVGKKPLLVIYEDKDSATVNQAMKDDLAKLAKGDKYKKSVALVPVADVSAYDFWPVKGFVKDSIRAESRKVGATIYCDWSGAFRSALGIARGTSSVVLVGRDGKVRFTSQGALRAADRAKLIEMLRAEVDAAP